MRHGAEEALLQLVRHAERASARHQSSHEHPTPGPGAGVLATETSPGPIHGHIGTTASRSRSVHLQSIEPKAAGDNQDTPSRGLAAASSGSNNCIASGGVNTGGSSDSRGGVQAKNFDYRRSPPTRMVQNPVVLLVVGVIVFLDALLAVIELTYTVPSFSRSS